MSLCGVSPSRMQTNQRERFVKSGNFCDPCEWDGSLRVATSFMAQENELVGLASASEPDALGNSSAPGVLASPVLLSPGALEAVAHLRALPFKKRHGWAELTAEPLHSRSDTGKDEQAEPSNVVDDDDADADSATAAELALVLQHDAIPERLHDVEHTPRFKWRSVCELSPLQQPDASARPGTFKWKTIDVPHGPVGPGGLLHGLPAPPTLGNSIIAQLPQQGPSPAPFSSGLMMPPPAPSGTTPGMAMAVQPPMAPPMQAAMQPTVLQPSVLQPTVLQPTVLQPTVLLQMPLASAPREPPPPPVMAPIMVPIMAPERALAIVPQKAAPKVAKWLPLAPKEPKAPKLGSAKRNASQLLASADQESSARRPTAMAGVSSLGAGYLPANLPAAPIALAVGGIILGPNLGPSPLQFQWVHVNMAPKMAPFVTAQDEAVRPDAQHGAPSTISSELPSKKPRKSCKELCKELCVVPAAQEVGPSSMQLPRPLIGHEAHQGQVVPLAVVMRLKGNPLLPPPTSQAQLVLSPARMVRLRLRGVHNTTSTLRQRPSAAHQ